VRDHLPQAAARRGAAVRALTAEIGRWGYRPLVTPLYEFDDVLRLGLDPVGRTAALRFSDPASGEILALRPDLTPQIARVAATRLKDAPGPIRIAYEGSVVRAGAARRPEELYQVGVELIDAPQSTADLEVVALCEASLHAAGVERVQIDLGHAGFGRAALEGVDDPELRALLAKKDARGVEARLAAKRVAAPRRRLIAQLPQLYGGPEVIAQARALRPPKAGRRALDELQTLIDRLSALGPRRRLSVDLGEVRGFDYYTGARFAVYAVGSGAPLASGGRYDRLIERYGRPALAVGFAVDVDRVAELHGGAARPSSGWLVAGPSPQIWKDAGRLRRSGAQVVVDLDERPPADRVLCERAERLGLKGVAVRRRGRLFRIELGAPSRRR
jgi:ATP phosphoribosyltransferase regulatory subunit